VKISAMEQDVITLSIYWREVLPDYPVPAESWLRGWMVNTRDVAVVMTAFEYCADALKDGHWPTSTSAESVGRQISAMLKRRREQFSATHQ